MFSHLCLMLDFRSSAMFSMSGQSARLAARLSYCGNMCLSYVQNRTWHFLAEKSKAFPEKEAVCMATYIAPKPLFTIYSKVYLWTPVSLWIRLFSVLLTEMYEIKPNKTEPCSLPLWIFVVFFLNGSSKEFTEFQVQLQDVIVITSYFIKFLFS